MFGARPGGYRSYATLLALPAGFPITITTSVPSRLAKTMVEPVAFCVFVKWVRCEANQLTTSSVLLAPSE